MISLSDIESLIIVKRREIEKEKSQLGLSPPLEESAHCENNKENAENPTKSKQVKFHPTDVLCQCNDSSQYQKGQALDEPSKEFDEHIPPGLERYIRRYIGLPVMLKAGEYSPNNPLVRAERTAGDALLGLGEYERRRNTLRKIRQQQYREYLDQQAKKKQEAKDQAERERREREQREKEREERERELLQERESYTQDRRRSLQQIQCTPSLHTPRDLHLQYVQPGTMNTSYSANKVDTAVQVDGFSAPLSVAVQTDEAELYQISPPPTNCRKTQMTQAERELSPRSVHAWPTHTTNETNERRRSYGDFDERTCLLKKCNRDKLTSDLRHSYMPSIFDADAIRLRNIQAEKEAAERKQYYQQELKNQILEQQRIKEERKNREKMLEQAEMRRLEEQLRMLRVAQDREVVKQQELIDTMNENTKEYNDKRAELQREIDMEERKLLRVSSQPNNDIPKRITNTSQSDNIPSKLSFYYSNIYEGSNEIDKKPYTTNIPDNSIFSANYDVDSYLRKNLNFKKDKVGKIFDRDDLESCVNEVRENKAYCDYEGRENKEFDKKALESLIKEVKEKRIVDKDHKTVEKDKIISKSGLKDKAFIIIKEQDRPNEVIVKQPSKNVLEEIDILPIPVLRHSPKMQNNSSDNTNMSDAMKKVDEKWQVPAVQKNILKAVPNDDGRNVSILTQLGSIRRQLQLEQLRLDKLMSKDNE